MIKKTIYIALVLGVLGLIAAYYFRQEVLLEGKTMGTTYHVKVISGWLTPVGSLQKQIDVRLKEINQSMSVFKKDSEITNFNNLKTPGEKFAVSKDFYQVMALAKKLHEWTDGAWDGTVMPLVNLWGFGNQGPKNGVPDAAALRKARLRVGFEHISVGPDQILSKAKPDVTLDLASIAKGYGVDAVAAVIRKNGFSDFLVEIGGEVYAAGVRKDGNPWRIGINRPEKDTAPTQVYCALPLNNMALATSGDYRNYFEINGVRYSHVIDPRTGYPVANGVVSVSILVTTCTIADGLATAVMVMGHEKGLALVNRLPGVECFIVVRETDGRLTDHLSTGFSLTG